MPGVRQHYPSGRRYARSTQPAYARTVLICRSSSSPEMSSSRRASSLLPARRGDARRHSALDLRSTYTSQLPLSSVPRCAVDDSLMSRASSSSPCQPRYDHTLHLSHPIERPREQRLRNFSKVYGKSIADRAAYYVKCGGLVANASGQKRGSCGSLVNRILAQQGLEQSQWDKHGSEICNISAATGAKAVYTGDSIKPGEYVGNS